MGRKDAGRQDKGHQKGCGGIGDADETPRSPDRLDVQDDHPDDLPKTQGHDGQIISLQAQGRQSHQIAHQTAGESGRQQGDDQSGLIAQESPMHGPHKENIH